MQYEEQANLDWLTQEDVQLNLDLMRLHSC
ncbi:hypothetical protein SAMN05216404_12510 [Nitrosospira multiformis]|uniref:Uncharacterized protein n=1 Tax=Nitrosospira multiformis TaxID=1231 RepID=A0A1H8Q1F0_9PROT|nr:hypothetical protein SAMN05216404_12510 [Nitrosospira multiformis]